MFIKGDILKASKRQRDKWRHFVVYFEQLSEHDFIGGMITHADFSQNLKMSADLFNTLDPNGTKYEVVYDGSFLVKAKLIKPHDWGPFSKVGELSEKGIEFFELAIKDLKLETFTDYLKSNKNI